MHGFHFTGKKCSIRLLYYHSTHRDILERKGKLDFREKLVKQELKEVREMQETQGLRAEGEIQVHLDILDQQEIKLARMLPFYFV